MACGIPVIASPVGMNSKVVRNGVNGFLASNPLEWTKAITKLINDSELRKVLGENGRRLVEQQYSLEHNAPKLKQYLIDDAFK
jgi:glycosyltransferase involved in cell wall biosynthesis